LTIIDNPCKSSLDFRFTSERLRLEQELPTFFTLACCTPKDFSSDLTPLELAFKHLEINFDFIIYTVYKENQTYMD